MSYANTKHTFTVNIYPCPPPPTKCKSLVPPARWLHSQFLRGSQLCRPHCRFSHFSQLRRLVPLHYPGKLFLVGSYCVVANFFCSIHLTFSNLTGQCWGFESWVPLWGSQPAKTFGRRTLNDAGDSLGSGLNQILGSF